MGCVLYATYCIFIKASVLERGVYLEAFMELKEFGEFEKLVLRCNAKFPKFFKLTYCPPPFGL